MALKKKSSSKRRIFIGAGIIVLIVFFTYIRIGLDDLVAHNARDTSMIGIEMLCESGPDFRLAADKHINMLQEYTHHMENKYLGGILEFFYEEYTPAKGFEKALKTLEKAKSGSQEECAKAIWLAGEQIEQYRMKAAGFAIFDSRLHKYQKVPDDLVADIKDALGESKKSFFRFKKNPTLENAVSLCEDDRWTMLLLFLAREGYNNGHNELFDEFHELEKQVMEEEQKLYEKIVGSQKKFLEHFIQSVQRRICVLEALKVGDDRKTCVLMWETIERAYHQRQAILEFIQDVD